MMMIIMYCPVTQVIKKTTLGLDTDNKLYYTKTPHQREGGQGHTVIVVCDIYKSNTYPFMLCFPLRVGTFPCNSNEP